MSVELYPISNDDMSGFDCLNIVFRFLFILPDRFYLGVDKLQIGDALARLT